MRFKKSPQLPGAGRTRAWHHHGSHTHQTNPPAVQPLEKTPKINKHTRMFIPDSRVTARDIYIDGRV